MWRGLRILQTHGLRRGSFLYTLVNSNHLAPRWVRKALKLRASGLSFFLVLLDILVELVREGEFIVDVAGVRVAGSRADLEILLLLPPQDLLAPGWVVAPLLDLLHQSAGPVLVEVAVFGE